MEKKKYFILVTFVSFIFLAVGFLTVLPKNAFPWNWSVHQSSGTYAFRIVFEQFNVSNFPDEYFFPYMNSGIIEPDKKKVRNHIKLNDCASGVNYYAKKCEKMISKQKNWTDIVFKMSQAAHYIQDQNSPHHSIGRYIKGAHEEFERWASLGYWTEDKFDGFQYITNYRTFTYNAARFSKRYFKFEKKISDIDYYKPIMEPLYDHTVNDIIDLWLTILYNGLGEEQYNKYSFPPKIGVRAEKKVKYPKIDKLAVEN